MVFEYIHWWICGKITTLTSVAQRPWLVVCLLFFTPPLSNTGSQKGPMNLLVCWSHQTASCLGSVCLPSPQRVRENLLLFWGTINDKLADVIGWVTCLFMILMSGLWYKRVRDSRLFVGPFNPILATSWLSLTRCRVVFGVLAGGSSPIPGPNCIIGAISGQLLVYWSVGVLRGGLVKTEKGCLLLLFIYTLGVSHM